MRVVVNFLNNMCYSTRSLGFRKEITAALFVLLALHLSYCANRKQSLTGNEPEDAFRIAYGSCARQWEDQPVWWAIVNSKPDVFVFLGDVMYADGVNMNAKKRAYAKLAAFPGFRELKRTTRVLAVWDDHDYGYNDAGGEYPPKRSSQRLFLDFFKEPADSPRRKRMGVYESYYFGNPPRRVQVILLDTRYFRDPLDKITPDPPFRTAYRPTSDVSRTMLGNAQWKWLEAELGKPADVRILASSIQFVAGEHRGEKWANFPHEKARLYGLIRKTRAAGLVVISGDRHYAEFSVDRGEVPYPIYDFTSSGLNVSWDLGAEEPNGARFAGPLVTHNFGILVIDWKKRRIRSEIRDEEGNILITHTVRFGELQFK